MAEEKLPIKELPHFSAQTRVYYRGSKDFGRYAYQYGTTSHQDNVMQPAAIIYPKCVHDIILAVNYARAHDIGVAVRTGGHQYSGASSTHGNNVQLDLSDTFQSVARDFRYNHKTKLLRVGISFSLLELNTLLRNMKMFLPHGICANVHLGGHVQTGGYGMLARSFGLLSDYVEGFEIVLANGKHEKIWRPNSPQAPKETTSENDDLYWAVLGGSPGNYGILTHVQVRPLHDEDYPDSRMMKVYTRYTKDKLEKCLQVMAEMSDNKDLERNFDYFITILTDASNSFYTRKAFKCRKRGKLQPKCGILSVDEQMMLNYPEQYGDGTPWAEEGKLFIPERRFPMLVIYFQWANVNGTEEQFGEKEIRLFEKVRGAMGPLILDAVELNAFEENPEEERINFVKNLLQAPDARPFKQIKYTIPTPISEMTRYWVYEDVREFVQPFEKRAYMTDKTDLSSNGWSEWLSGRVDVIAEGFAFDESVNLQLQVFLVGGENSMYSRFGADAPQNSSHSWRDESRMCLLLDGFYAPHNEEALKTVLKWTAVNDEAANVGGIFCDKDRRVLWGSYSRLHDNDGGANLDSVWDKYFDSKEKYDKLVLIKRRVDPEYLFTANAFSVDASNAPKEKRLMIFGRGHEQLKHSQELKRSLYSCSSSSSNCSSADSLNV